jgi:hypothetical protein
VPSRLRAGRAGAGRARKGAATANGVDGGEGMVDGSAPARGQKEARRRRASAQGGQAVRQPRLRVGMGASSPLRREGRRSGLGRRPRGGGEQVSASGGQEVIGLVRVRV